MKNLFLNLLTHPVRASDLRNYLAQHLTRDDQGLAWTFEEVHGESAELFTVRLATVSRPINLKISLMQHDAENAGSSSFFTLEQAFEIRREILLDSKLFPHLHNHRVVVHKLKTGKFSALMRGYQTFYQKFKSTWVHPSLHSIMEKEHALNEHDLEEAHVSLMASQAISQTTPTLWSLGTLPIPEDITLLMQDIRALATELTARELSLTQRLDLDNLYAKRLPQVLSQHAKISPLYAQSVSVPEEHPDAILRICMLEIKHKISDIFNQVQAQHHTQQKITQQYLLSL